MIPRLARFVGKQGSFFSFPLFPAFFGSKKEMIFVGWFDYPDLIPKKFGIKTFCKILDESLNVSGKTIIPIIQATTIYNYLFIKRM